jgi:hypothetical protein
MNMKNIVFVSLIAVLSVLVSQSTFAQCDSETFSNKALKALQPGFTFVKSYKIDGKNGVRKTIEYTCVFSKDTSYMIRMEGKDGGPNGIIAVLFDSNRQELATSYVNNRFFPGWTYKCKATGIYYLNFKFQDSQTYCGAAVLGFRR